MEDDALFLGFDLTAVEPEDGGPDPDKIIKTKVSKLYEFDGLNKVEVKEAGIGSIVAIFHGITIGSQSKGIQPGVFRAPRLEIYRLRCISRIRCRIGDAGGKRKHNRGMREPKGILLLRNFTYTHLRE